MFDLLRHKCGDTLALVRCTKATLVHLSHTLEDLVLREQITALFFTGFQEAKHWREETERYRALAGLRSRSMSLPAVRCLPESSAKELHIPLHGDDPQSS